MQVILLSDQRHLGKRGQVLKVKPGYGRNYLIPHGLALEATPGNMKVFEQQRHRIDAAHAREREASEQLAATIKAVHLRVPKKVGESGTLYGSVTSSEIAAMLEAKGITVDRRRIDLEGHGLKTLGDHTVHIHLHSEVVAELTVTVEPEE